MVGSVMHLAAQRMLQSQREVALLPYRSLMLRQYPLSKDVHC